MGSYPVIIKSCLFQVSTNFLKQKMAGRPTLEDEGLSLHPQVKKRVW